jgi:hypothetical protein
VILASDGDKAPLAEVTSLILQNCPKYQAEICETLGRRNPRALEFGAQMLIGTILEFPTRVPHPSDRELPGKGIDRHEMG